MDEMEVDKPADEKGKDSPILETAQTESKDNMAAENSDQPMDMEIEPPLNTAPILSQTEDELLNDSLDLESEMNTFLGVSLNSDDSTNEEQQITKELEKTKESDELELEKVLLNDDKTGGGDTVLDDKDSALSKVDKGDDMEKEFNDESKLSGAGDVIKSIPGNAEIEEKETAAEFVVKEVPDKTKDTTNDLENKQPEKNAAKKEPVRQIDFDDASMDGMNEGDALGLLAETEGRERHSSDPEDEDEEEREENSDAESSDALSEAPEESSSNTTDEEYEPQEDDEEDDDEIDAQDEDGHHFRVAKRTTIDTPDENSFEGVEMPLENELDIDDGIEDSMDIEESTDMMAILNVTSLATGDTIENGGMAFNDENDTDSNFEKDDNSQPVLIISSICSVDKSVIDQIVSATKEADAEAEADAEVEAALEEAIGGDSAPIKASEDIEAVTDIIETIGLNAGVIKDIPVEAEEFEEIGSVVKALLNFESLEEPSKPVATPLRTEEEAGGLDETPAKDLVFQDTDPGIEDIAMSGEKTPEKTPIVEEKSTEMVDAISSETESNLEVLDVELHPIAEKISELAVAESDDIQNVCDSLLDLEQNKNKRKADESFEKVTKKLDTKVVPSSADEDSVVEKEPSGVAFRSFHDGPIFPEADATKDVMESAKLQDEFQSTLDSLQSGLDTVPEASVMSEVVKMEEEELIIDMQPMEELEPMDDVVISSTCLLLGPNKLTEERTSPQELEALPQVADAESLPDTSAKVSEAIPSSVLEESTNEQTALDSEVGATIIEELASDKKAEEEVTAKVVEESAMEKVPVVIKTELESVVSPKPAAEQTVQTISQVFSLDSDDEETVPDTTMTTTPLEVTDKPAEPAEPVSEVIVKSAKKILPGKKCVNPACSQRGTDCPLFLPSLFRARDLKAVPAACQDCLNKGVTLMEILSTRLKRGLCLFDVEMPNNGDMVEISDSDSDSDVAPSKLSTGTRKTYTNSKYKPRINSGPVLDPKDVDFLTKNLEDGFNDTWTNYKMPEQLTMCENTMIMEMDMLNAQSIELGKMIDLEQVDLDRMRKYLYESFRPPTECRKEVLISDHGNTVVETHLMSERRSARAVKKSVVYDETSKSKRDEVVRAVSPIITADGVINDSTMQDAATLKNKADLPPLGTLPDHDLKVGDTVYAVKQSIFGAWCPAKILQILPKGTLLANGTFSLFSLVRVRFITMTEAGRPNKQVTGRQLAYPDPAPVRYPIGTRVIALFKNTKQPVGGVQTSAYYSGVVAEVPLRANRYRYLVFSDDGYARYVSHCNVLFVCERSIRVWEDVHPDSRDFVRKYLQGYPNQPMVRVEAGHSIRTEYSGKFWFSHVLAVDSSLALIKFSESSGAPVTREEWIYRGSTRLEPLFLELQAADRRSQGRHRASYATTNLTKNKNFPYVEYSRPEQAEWEENLPTMPAADDVPVLHIPEEPEQRPMEEEEREEREEEEPAANRSVARKSTAKGDHLLPPRSGHQLQADQVKSKVVYYSPKVSIRPAKLVPHTCGSSCLNREALPLRDLRTYNPLARPLLSGWQRLILKYRGKRTIVYRAPCGRRLRSPQELHLYLRLTGSQMSVDLFDFDHWVHCLAEFVPTKCFVSKRDLSHGGEAVPVPCVNYYDHSLPEFSSYSTRRIPTQGVHLNLDEEFLCGCDCTDDCQDKSRCQCWQLTLEGAQVVRSQPDKVGYQYKRLLDPVPTGIYECNSRCKCAATCLNRVAQHPLQLKLQVFKTFNRGWGIRALNDVSRGTFLCIYAGNLLTDAVANVDGVNEGDEYLAELDYIEVVERLKENYESDVPTESESDDNSEPEQRPSSNRDGKTGQHGESDEEFTPGTYVKKGKLGSLTENTRMSTRRQQRKDKDDSPRRSDKALKAIAAKELQQKQKEAAAAEAKKARAATVDRQSKDSDTAADGAAPVVDEFIIISDDEETMREPSRFAAPEGLNEDEYLPKHRSVRSFFGKDEACYIMDAKVQGNLGRYLNHSCSPNVFVQNVFVDTHDPRFPWVAFFTLNHVRAGTELTWNYNYDVGSVPGKALYCGCGATNCRGRLL